MKSLSLSFFGDPLPDTACSVSQPIDIEINSIINSDIYLRYTRNAMKIFNANLNVNLR